MTRVLIAHRYPAMRAGLRGALARAQGIQVVAETGKGERALQLVRQLGPDVALVACSLAGAADGVGVLERAKRVRVLVLSAPGDDGLVHRMCRAGAAGRISERAELQSTVQAHLRNILSKLEVSNRAQAAVFAVSEMNVNQMGLKITDSGDDKAASVVIG